MRSMPDTTLIEQLRNPALYPETVTSPGHKPVELIETHISWVLLTGDFAYKIKKPVALGFLDFSTLARRKYYCEEELRLNRRLAPDWYLDVVPIFGSPEQPSFARMREPQRDPEGKPVGDPSGEPAGEYFGAPIEYALKMRQFDADQRLDKVLEAGCLSGDHLSQLAADIADFHASLPPPPASSDFGTPEEILKPCAENFVVLRTALRALLASSDARAAGLSAQIKAIRRWSESQGKRLRSCFEARQLAGFVRECHGDLHLENLFLDRGLSEAGHNSGRGSRVVAFDCIEFDPQLRWIDVMNEIAFLVMDLDSRFRTDLGFVFLNAYLERSGDYAGVTVLRYYLVYRAMVRAKVEAIRSSQATRSEPPSEDLSAVERHLELACNYIQGYPADPRGPLLITTIGLSGSGKTTLTNELMAAQPAIRLRSDVERKRMFKGDTLYTRKATEEVYRRLAEKSAQLLQAGFNVIVDATFLDTEKRRQFPAMVTQLLNNVTVYRAQLYCYAPTSVLEQRVMTRAAAARDASDADLDILRHQLASFQEPLEDEASYTVRVDTSRCWNAGELCRQLKALAQDKGPLQQQPK